MPKFQPGRSGNPSGRRPGTKTKRTEALERILDGDAEAIVGKAIEKAREGDPIALRLCLERVLPVRRDRHVSFALPEIKTASDLMAGASALLQGVAAGELTPSEALEVAKIFDIYRNVLETVDMEARISAMETHRSAPREDEGEEA